MWLKCISCGKEYPPEAKIYTCPSCNSLLDVVLDYAEISNNVSWSLFKARAFKVWRYREFLPIEKDEYIVSLGEGGTPLYRCDKLAKWVGIKDLYVKYEGANPTGSFKDRGMTVGVSKALELKAKVVACASTGNTSASLSAYAAKAGLKCLVLLPAGKVALGKLAQALMHGAEVVAIKGNFDDALKLVIKLSMERDVYLLNSVNPWRLEGQKTLAYEVVDQLGFVPEYVAVPMGNCGNISAIYKGFKELSITGLADATPKMIGVQAEGAAPVVEMLEKGLNTLRPIEKPETLATAIRIGNPINWPKAINAMRESKGIAIKVSDAEIIEAQKAIARLEGLGVEPASAASVAGLKKLVEHDKIPRDAQVVAVCTGHLLKDPEEVVEVSEKFKEIEASMDELEKIVLAKL
ncbi:MAG: threonine synthase [Candidatus Methanomethylicota archaeon]|uniref:Threonine synthase n=1 Tax=Thermoproteota archaeon TaxID=2056631 RepID=A0A497EUP3_9CREN|nr:MAG: threonine synthase [Candidatus Verstraetearchaeota archaeon]